MTGSCLFRLLVAAVFMALVVGRATAVIQCSDAVSQLLPCEGFLLGGETAPSSACCSAAQSLEKTAMASKGDRKAICECFKEVAKSFPINLAKAQQVPQLCHVSIGVSVDPNINCNRI